MTVILNGKLVLERDIMPKLSKAIAGCDRHGEVKLKTILERWKAEAVVFLYSADNSTIRADVGNSKPLTRESFIADTLGPSNPPTTNSQPSPKRESKYSDDPDDGLEEYYNSDEYLKDAEDQARWMEEHKDDIPGS